MCKVFEQNDCGFLPWIKVRISIGLWIEVFTDTIKREGEGVSRLLWYIIWLVLSIWKIRYEAWSLCSVQKSLPNQTKSPGWLTQSHSASFQQRVISDRKTKLKLSQRRLYFLILNILYFFLLKIWTFNQIEIA